MLNDFRIRFKDEIDEIRELHKRIKENYEFILNELKRSKERKNLLGECDFVR